MFIGDLTKFIEPYIKNIWKLEIGYLGRKNRGRIAVGRGRVVEKEIRDELLLMHGIRVAIIHEIFFIICKSTQNLVIKRVHLEMK